MKTIQHTTTVKSVEGKELPQALERTTNLQIPETQEDILQLCSEKGVAVVCKWITDTLKLERNGEVRPQLLTEAGLAKITQATRDKVIAWYIEKDVVAGLALMREPASVKNPKLDKMYNDADEVTKQKILSR